MTSVKLQVHRGTPKDSSDLQEYQDSSRAGMGMRLLARPRGDANDCFHLVS